MNRKKLVIISLGLYFTTGIITGGILVQTFAQWYFLIYLPLIGVLEWFLFFIGYLRPKIRSQLPFMKIFVFYCLSVGAFLPALWISVTLFDHNL